MDKRYYLAKESFYYIPFLALVFISILAAMKFGFLIGGFIAIGLWSLGAVLVYLLEERKKVRFYSNLIDPIFVVSNHPVTNNKIIVPSVQKYIVHAEHEKVNKKVKSEEDLLKKSGNLFFVSEDLKSDQKIWVQPLIFQSGKYRTENWEEFRIRVKTYIETCINAWHEKMEKEDQEWYSKFANHQV